MKQFQYFIILQLIVFLLFSISLKAQIIIDANLTEWGDYKNMQFDKENKLYYAFKKDNQFLYFAILKKDNSSKFLGGGVQLYFSQKQKDTTSLQILFANSFKDPVTNQNQRYNHDYFTVKNLTPNSHQQLTTNNETGILLEWNITDIKYLVVNGDVLDTKATPPDPNIFSAEIQIPLEHLQKYKTDETINFGIALRGTSFRINPTLLLQMRKSTINSQYPYSQESLDRLIASSFFETIDLKSVPFVN
ncbi:hypothetical protein HYN56_00300 [Flavobacterium crocinum]|uniref:Uncharacterized protein n=1 Tax=Flavobacterium crocinum TaxID=2183896 RepID=A0A2S1YFB1_9FLAO|nr:hypothetical protein [Flavobacterium crocinum]AWK02737.1 hypothetical protein HYN56_00300 [Flavobacterium crocinum]